MTHRSKSTLFLIEQLIVIAVFAICAVACISILTAAYFNANDSKSTSHAILRAESAAEVFKATGGDENAVLGILEGTRGERHGYSGVTVYYNNDWQVSNEGNASYVLHIGYHPRRLTDALILADLTVDRITGEELVTFPLAVQQSLRGLKHNG